MMHITDFIIQYHSLLKSWVETVIEMEQLYDVYFRLDARYKHIISVTMILHDIKRITLPFYQVEKVYLELNHA